jgi:phosphoribosylformylglycinamidine synthase PurS subunit
VRFPVVVEIRPREGLADPEGATIERAIAALGFSGIGGVRVGKAVRFTVEAADEAAAVSRVEELCRRFLTNPVIEDAFVQIEHPPSPLEDLPA